ncbi:hypothetical protein N665_0012s0179 [Sinapis alba]|nr:hypothetical protein N665_0012s0179 [Sinapis alba]
MSVADRLLEDQITPDRSDTISSLTAPRNKMDTILLHLCFQTAIYLLWRERNSRRHGGAWIPVEAITRTIEKCIRNHIMSLRYSGTHKLEGLLRRLFEVSPS